jgi:hypothetical protein
MKYFMLTSLLLTSLNAHAALNKWIDAEGKVHYSDTVPIDVKVQKLKTSPTSGTENQASSGVPVQKTIAEQDAEWKKAQKAKEEAEKKSAKEQEIAQIKQKNCENARNNLEVYENSPNVVTYNAQGERNFLDESARAQKIDDARKVVNTQCN